MSDTDVKNVRALVVRYADETPYPEVFRYLLKLTSEEPDCVIGMRSTGENTGWVLASMGSEILCEKRYTGASKDSCEQAIKKALCDLAGYLGYGNKGSFHTVAPRPLYRSVDEHLQIAAIVCPQCDLVWLGRKGGKVLIKCEGCSRSFCDDCAPVYIKIAGRCVLCPEDAQLYAEWDAHVAQYSDYMRRFLDLTQQNEGEEPTEEIQRLQAVLMHPTRDLPKRLGTDK